MNNLLKIKMKFKFSKEMIKQYMRKIEDQI